MPSAYFVVWTSDLSTPRAIGLGSSDRPWPSPDLPWPTDGIERDERGYPWDASLPLLDALRPEELEPFDHDEDPDPWPEAATAALAGRPVVRFLLLPVSEVPNAREVAVLFANAGGGVAWDENSELLAPPETDPARQRAAQDAMAAALFTELSAELRRAAQTKTS